MRNFIVRVYREKGPDKKLVGIVEEVGVEDKMAFKGLEELCAILSRTKKGGGKIQKQKKKGLDSTAKEQKKIL
jgi:hypothetical protein